MIVLSIRILSSQKAREGARKSTISLQREPLSCWRSRLLTLMLIAAFFSCQRHQQCQQCQATKADVDSSPQAVADVQVKAIFARSEGAEPDTDDARNPARIPLRCELVANTDKTIVTQGKGKEQTCG